MLGEIHFGFENEHKPEYSEWYHSVCGLAYPYIFKMVSVDAADSFILSTDCGAGLVSMMLVCARSLAEKVAKNARYSVKNAIFKEMIHYRPKL